MTIQEQTSERLKNRIKSRVLHHWGLLDEDEFEEIENTSTPETNGVSGPEGRNIAPHSKGTPASEPRQSAGMCFEKPGSSIHSKPVTFVTATFISGLIAGVVAGVWLRG
jgi:hypothetical protein